MVKVVIDARESGTSTGRYVDKLIEYLYKLKPDFDMVVLTKKHRVDFFKKIAPGFAVQAVSYKEFTFAEQWGFWRFLKKLKPSLVHFSIVQQPILYQGKTITTMHDLTTTRFKNPSKNAVVFWVKQQVYKAINRIAAHRSRFVLVPSMFVKNDVLQFARLKNPDKVIVTYEAADKIEEPAEVVEELEHARFIMYVGRPMPHKNLPRLIEAFKLLKEKYPDLTLVLAGKKDVLFEQMENHVHSVGVPDIVFTGFVSEGELRWLYEHCAAYVFPSLSEGFGLPSLEAMQHGAPVVSSNATCLPEINGEAAQYFDPTDVNAMALAIESVLTSDELRSTLIERGKLQVEKYSWQRMAELTLETYKRALMKDKD